MTIIHIDLILLFHILGLRLFKPLQSGVAFCVDQRLVDDEHWRLHSTTANSRLPATI